MGWEFSDHVCRVCLGRVLLGLDAAGKPCARCAECGLQASGGHAALCACGAVLKSGKNANLRCVLNERVGTDAPFEVLVRYVGPANQNKQRRNSRQSDFMAVSAVQTVIAGLDQE